MNKIDLPPSDTQQLSKVISSRQRMGEIAAVVLTGLGKFIFMDTLQLKLPFILVAIISWLTYVIIQHKRIPGILHYWGFRSDNFGRVLKIILPFAIIFVVMSFAAGFLYNTINLTWHIFPILILYPIWGTIQQFLCIGLVTGNLKDMNGAGLTNGLIAVVTALLFSLLHYPFYWLMLGTFIMALLYALVYLRERNLFVLGIFHGWQGAILFYTLVNRDPFTELFAKLF